MEKHSKKWYNRWWFLLLVLLLGFALGLLIKSSWMEHTLGFHF